jgi:hypothetical protein
MGLSNPCTILVGDVLQSKRDQEGFFDFPAMVHSHGSSRRINGEMAF